MRLSPVWKARKKRRQVCTAGRSSVMTVVVGTVRVGAGWALLPHAASSSASKVSVVHDRIRSIVRLSGQVLDCDGFDGIGQLEPKDSRVEVQLAIQGTFDVFCSTESMSLALVRHVSVG